MVVTNLVFTARQILYDVGIINILQYDNTAYVIQLL